MGEQLIKKNCATGEYKEMYPITTLAAIKDPSSGKTLDEIIEEFNHIYLPFKDNSKTYTRLQVPSNLRRKGLWITYISCKGNTITEWYNSDDFSNEAWGDNSNWVPYLDKQVIKEALNKVLSWYKA